jgi:drug/metabolite transporter (DMT)-like permease
MFRSPRNLFLALLVFTVLCFVLAGLIGQHNDGPWGGLPEWLGSASWFGFLLGLLATVIAGIYWLAQSVRARGRAAGTE